MNLSDQVCSPEQAVRLKELGVMQKSLFYFHDAFKVPVFGEKFLPWGNSTQVCNDKEHARSAFTSSELAAMLPDARWAVPYKYEKLDLDSDVFTETKIKLHINTLVNGYVIAIESLEGTELHSMNNFHLAHCLADMLIFLLEKDLISLEYVNEMLAA